MIEYIVFFFLIVTGIIFYMKSSKWEVEPNNSNEFAMGYELSKCESPIETRVCRALWANDIPVKSQYRVGSYRIDLAIPSIRLAIECDGKAFHSTPAQKAHDRKRTAYLKRQGWKVIRFSGSQIVRDIGKVINRVENEISKR